MKRFTPIVALPLLLIAAYVNADTVSTAGGGGGGFSGVGTLTTGRCVIAGSASSLTDDADCTFSGSTLTTTNHLIGAGTALAPSLAYSGATNNGFYYTSNPYLAYTYGNQARILYNFGNAAIIHSSDLMLGWASASDVATNGIDTAIGRAAAGYVKIGDSDASPYIKLGHDGTYGVVSTSNGAGVILPDGNTGVYNLSGTVTDASTGLINPRLGASPNGMVFSPSSNSNSFRFWPSQADRKNGPCGTSACTTTTLILQSDTTDSHSVSLYHDATNGIIEAGAGRMTVKGAAGVTLLAGGGNEPYINGGLSTDGGSFIYFGGIQTSPSWSRPAASRALLKRVDGNSLWFGGQALTDGAAAATVVSIPIASNNMTAGELHYSIQATAGSDFQVRYGGWIKFGVYNAAGTETCSMAVPSGTIDSSIIETEDTSAIIASTGTLTYTITCSTSPTNGVAIQFAADSSLTTPTITIEGHLDTFQSVNQTAPSVP